MFNADAFMARLSGPTLLMGILNVTPDSFSDGGQFDGVEAACAQATRMTDEGADIIDIGGESTRPGHLPVPAKLEAQRVLPVIEHVAKGTLPVSIDTYKAKTARLALAAGATIINDVWGLQNDAEMAPVIAEFGVPVICMHNREAVDPTLDILSDVMAFLERSLIIARKAGIPEHRIILDPGFGFGKTFAQSLHLLRNLETLSTLGRPLLIGLSRKGFIGHYSGEKVTPNRLAGTLAANMLAITTGYAAIIRVHDVKPHRQMLDMREAFDTA
ncbi:MAG: dihydropteroate synthase [Alphaproteobacteria bacterium]